MAWVRIDDGFAQHPKVVSAGPLAMAMQIAALCYCNKNLTDGFIPWPVARSLLSWEFLGSPSDDTRGRIRYRIAVTSGVSGDDVDSDFVIGLLTSAGIWEEVDGGYKIHDYLDWNLSKDDVLTLRSARAGAGRMGGLAKAQASAIADVKQTLKQNRSKVLPPSPSPSPSPSDSPSDSPAPAPAHAGEQDLTPQASPSASPAEPDAGEQVAKKRTKEKKAKEDYISGLLPVMEKCYHDAHGMVLSAKNGIRRQVIGHLVAVAKSDGYKTVAANTAEVERILAAYFADQEPFVADGKHPITLLLSSRLDRYRRPLSTPVQGHTDA